MRELKNDPGHINGFVIVKKSIPCYEEYTVISEEESEEDNGWFLTELQTIQPVIKTEKIFIGYEYVWQVYTNDEYRNIGVKYSGDMYYF